MARIKCLGMAGTMGWMGGEKPIRHSRKKRKRTHQTYQKKINQLKSFYNKLVKKQGKFSQKYSTFEDFLKKYNLKKSDKEA